MIIGNTRALCLRLRSSPPMKTPDYPFLDDLSSHPKHFNLESRENHILGILQNATIQKSLRINPTGKNFCFSGSEGVLVILENIWRTKAFFLIE